MNATRIIVAVCDRSAASAGAGASPEPPPGAASCSGCHAAGASVETPVPPLDGRTAADIVAQMQAFKTGKRTAPSWTGSPRASPTPRSRPSPTGMRSRNEEARHA